VCAAPCPSRSKRGGLRSPSSWKARWGDPVLADTAVSGVGVVHPDRSRTPPSRPRRGRLCPSSRRSPRRSGPRCERPSCGAIRHSTGLPDGGYSCRSRVSRSPSELVRTGPEAAVALEANQARPRTELAYWPTVRRGGRRHTRSCCWVPNARCQGRRRSWPNRCVRTAPEVQLVAGSINRARAAMLRPQLMLRGAMKVAAEERRRPPAKQRSADPRLPAAGADLRSSQGRRPRRRCSPARVLRTPRSSSSPARCRGAGSSARRPATTMACRCRCGTRSSAVAARRSATASARGHGPAVPGRLGRALQLVGEASSTHTARGAISGCNQGASHHRRACRRIRARQLAPPSAAWPPVSGLPRPTR